MGSLANSATMQSRLQECRACNSYPSCPTSQQIAQPAAACPLPEPRWNAEVSTFLQQIHSFGTAVQAWTASGFQATPPDALAEREAICRSCPEWDSTGLAITGRCKICLCSTWAKLRMATERCPLGKWQSSLPPAP